MRKELFASKKGLFVLLGLMAMGVLVMMPLGCGGSSSGGGSTTYTVGGTVSSLTGTVTLQNNSTDDLTLTADGSFTFTTALADGDTYNVQVSGQPTTQTCTVSAGTGTISGADVTNVAVACLDNVSISGIVLDPSGTGVGDATVGAYRFDDSTLISFTTSAATGATGSFTVTGIPQNVEIYLKAGKTGYISGNTRTKTLTANDSGVEVMILPDTDPGIIDIANRLASQNESSWDSTLQAFGYLVMNAEDVNTDDLTGLTVTGQPVGGGSPLNVYYASNLPDGSGTFISAPPTVARASTNELPMMGAAIPSTFGSYAMSGAVVPGTLEETAINAPIIAGEFTYFEWYQSTIDVVKLNAVDEDYVDFGSMAGFTYSTDWSVIEKVQIPADADTTAGGWHTFRGHAFNDGPGDIALGFAYGATPGIQSWYGNGGWTTLKKDMTLVKGNWYTVCLQYDYSANSLALYVDGSAAPAVTTVGSADDRANTNTLYWGGQYATGAWADLYSEEDVTFANQAWYQRLLTPTEIDAYDGAVDNTDPTLFFSTQVDTANTVVHDLQSGIDGINGNSPVYSFQKKTLITQNVKGGGQCPPLFYLQ